MCSKVECDLCSPTNQNTGHRNAIDDEFDLQTPVATFVLNKQDVSITV